MAAIIAKLYKQIFIVSNWIFMAKKGIRKCVYLYGYWNMNWIIDFLKNLIGLRVLLTIFD